MSNTNWNQVHAAKLLGVHRNTVVKMMKRQSHDRVRQMLDLLPEDQREVIILRHYADLSFKEIAELTNTNINTCIGRMHYALLNLRRMIKKNPVSIK